METFDKNVGVILGADRNQFKIAPKVRIPDIKEVRAAIPAHCFKKDTFKSLCYAFGSTALWLGFTYLCWNILPELSWSPLPIALWVIHGAIAGTLATGCWVVGHECGHHAFSDNELIQDTVGLILHTALLVPYYAWARSHAVHHSRTNHVIEGETHTPKDALSASGRADLRIFKVIGEDAFAIWNLVAHFVFGWPAYLFTGATGGRERGYSNHFDPNSNEDLFPKSWRLRMWISTIAVIAWVGVLAWFTSTYGSSALVGCYILPYLFSNCWLVGYTWLQHTDVDIPHLDKTEWTWLRGAFLTVDRPYPYLIDLVHHHIGSTHVVHHIFHTLPHYHAKEATEAVKKAFPDLYMYDPTPIGQAFYRVAKHCIAVEEVVARPGHHYFVVGEEEQQRIGHMSDEQTEAYLRKKEATIAEVRKYGVPAAQKKVEEKSTEDENSDRSASPTPLGGDDN